MKSDSALRDRYLKQYQDIYGETVYLSPIGTSENDLNVEGGSDLTAFYHLIKDCQKCSLGETRTNFVFGVGNPNAEIVFVGEAPDKNEDLQGEPFVGGAGQLLDKILAAINLTRHDIYILNLLKCRPPENRNPLPSEIELCEDYLKKQLKIIKPKLIVALGKIVGNTILRKDETLENLREKIHNYEGIDFIVTYHPAALLRNPALKKPTWDDFKMIRDNYITNG
jgi:DNA polymerase